MTPRDNAAGRLGHNQGPPLDPGRSWRSYCWKQARKQLTGSPPIEVVRRRMRRAAQVGLTYRRYETIVITGGDADGLVFAAESLIAPRGRPRLADAVIRKLKAISGCKRVLLGSASSLRLIGPAAPTGPGLFDVHAPLSAAASLSYPLSKQDREALRGALRGQSLAASRSVLIGGGACGPGWVAAARLAGFVPSDEYFGG